MWSFVEARCCPGLSVCLAFLPGRGPSCMAGIRPAAASCMAVSQPGAPGRGLGICRAPGWGVGRCQGLLLAHQVWNSCGVFPSAMMSQEGTWVCERQVSSLTPSPLVLGCTPWPCSAAWSYWIQTLSPQLCTLEGLRRGGLAMLAALKCWVLAPVARTPAAASSTPAGVTGGQQAGSQA